MAESVGLEGFRRNYVRLPVIGKIRLGVYAKNQNDKMAVQASDHFLLHDIPEPYQARVIKAYGKEPKHLDIVLPVEREKTVLSLSLGRWGKSKKTGEPLLLCSSDDGKTAIRVDFEKGLKEQIPCCYKKCADFIAGKCTESVYFLFFLPTITASGVFQIRSGSWNSFNNLMDSLILVRNVYGRISGIPLILALEPQKGMPLTDKGFIPTSFYVLRAYMPDLPLAQALKARNFAELSAPAGQSGLPAICAPAQEGWPPEDITEAEIMGEEGQDGSKAPAPSPPPGDTLKALPAASPAASEGKSTAPAPGGKASVDKSKEAPCADCGQIVYTRVINFSMSAWGRVLCYKCQEKEKEKEKRTHA